MNQPRIVKATASSIAAAAERLIAQGKYPSAKEIAAITGGSLSTITPLRDEWWARFCTQYRTGRFLPGMPEAVSDLLRDVWNKASDLAFTQYLNDRSDFEARLEAAAAREATAHAQAQANAEMLVQLERDVEAIKVEFAVREQTLVNSAQKAEHERLEMKRSAEQQAIQASQSIAALTHQILEMQQSMAQRQSSFDAHSKAQMLSLDEARTQVKCLEKDLIAAKDEVAADKERHALAVESLVQEHMVMLTQIQENARSYRTKAESDKEGLLKEMNHQAGVSAQQIQKLQVDSLLSERRMYEQVHKALQDKAVAEQALAVALARLDMVVREKSADH